MTYDGIVLAGGNARRMGGLDKPALMIGGRRLLDIAIDALDGASQTVVVGPTVPTERGVRWAREDPVGGGPVSALAAALPLLRSPLVVVVASDLPFVTAGAVDSLVRMMDDAIAAMAIDHNGRDQPLLACYDRRALATAIPSQPHEKSMRSLLDALGADGAVRRIDLGGEPPVTLDCDTADDLSHARELA